MTPGELGAGMRRPGEVGTGPRMPGEVTLGLLLIVGGVLPVIGAGPTPGVAPNVPIVPNGAPGAVLPPIDEPPVTAPGAIPNTCCLPKLGIATLGALPNEPGAELNVPPVIGAGPTPGVAPNVPIVPNGAPRAAGWAKHTGAAAINAAATACTMNFCLSMRSPSIGKKVKPFAIRREPRAFYG
jgi:hypothetical protein